MCVYVDVCVKAFDMQRDLQITPRRLEYTREKECELFSSLMDIANRKQEEIKEMIVETLGAMKDQLLEDAANLEFTGQYTNTHTYKRQGQKNVGPLSNSGVCMYVSQI